MFFAEHKRVNFVFELCMKKSSVGLDLLQTQSLSFPLSLAFNVLSRWWQIIDLINTPSNSSNVSIACKVTVAMDCSKDF